ncbi:hypothetical protein EZS27_040784 [termite gut metagenome]|uniref:Tc1-like transposase DDE domain-containing protein n=1 Tax=termite gut metagenome TaxID=433724 RepID=A0A5J4PG05_9ZZZZ
MDNAKYQRCSIVSELAEKLKIELLFLPAYSANLNLIERLWKWIKKDCLYCKYYERFSNFKKAIEATLQKVVLKKRKVELDSLLTLKFRLINILRCYEKYRPLFPRNTIKSKWEEKSYPVCRWTSFMRPSPRCWSRRSYLKISTSMGQENPVQAG